MTTIVTQDHMAEVMRSIRQLVQREVLVGIPSDKAERNTPGDPINNATIGYIMEHGSPAKNIPARPHLIPGIANAQPAIIERFAKAGRAGVQGDLAEADRQLAAAGMAAASSVKSLINSGLSPALADATLASRVRRNRAAKGAAAELARRAQGVAPGSDLAKPLIESGQYRNAITYVLKKK